MKTASGWPQGWAAISARRGKEPAWSWGAHLRCRAQHCPHHAVVRTASAKIAVERGPYVLGCRIWILLQQRSRAHQDAGDAITALQRLLVDEGALQRVGPLRISEALDGRDLLVRDRP